MSNENLIRLVKWHDIYRDHQSPEFDRVLEAMLKVDRKDFLGEEPVKLNEQYSIPARDLAYSDQPLPIGHGQTCSQPSVVAFMVYLLELGEGMKAFEIGLGCGYSAAVTLRLIGNGRLVTAELIPELVEKGTRNLEAHFGKQGLERRLKIINQDGSAGLDEEEPVDRIYLTAGVKLKSFDPSQLARHIKHTGGILLFPEEEEKIIIKQRYAAGVKIYEKRYGGKYGGVSFVPLMGKNS